MTQTFRALILLILLSSCSETPEIKEPDSNQPIYPKLDDSVEIVNSANEDLLVERKSLLTIYDTIPKEIKLSLIDQLNSQFDYLKTEGDGKTEHFDDFHFIDLDADNDLDLIFDGWSGGEPNCVRIFLNKEGEFVQVFDVLQYVSDIHFSDEGLVNISIEDPGCCDPREYFNEDYIVIPTKDSLEFFLSERTAGIWNTQLPKTWSTSNERFVHNNTTSFLRAVPTYDTLDFWGNIKKTDDNIIAEFEGQFKGNILSEIIDDKGVNWWFIEIDEMYKPIHSQFYDINEKPTKLRGWIESDSSEKR